MDFNSGLSIVVAIFAIITVVATALAFARANFAKAQIEALRGDVSDYEKRTRRLEDDKAELQQGLATEKAAREALEKVVTGRDLMEALLTTLNNHHEKSMTSLQALYQTLEQLLDAVETTRNDSKGTGGT